MSDDGLDRFVPVSARPRVVAGGPCLLSGTLLARHADRIAAPILEVTARRAAVLVGFLSACRQESAIAAVAVPAGPRLSSPRAPALVLDGVLAAATTAGFSGALVAVARAEDALLDGVRLRERVARDVEAGYTAIGVASRAIGADVEELARIAPVLAELDLGLELELSDDRDAGLLLAQIDELRLPITAVRGAHALDERGGAALVVDVAGLADVRGLDLPAALRINVDALLPSADADDDDDVIEMRAWSATHRMLAALRAGNTAERLADALAESGG